MLFYQLRITDCAGYGYGPDTYLAQCASKTYGDYEHGALGLQIDSEAIQHLERAQIVVLGHSHAMVAFSTAPTRQYFRRKGIGFYNAALSGEYSAFFDFFLARVRLDASIVVIDVAPFFFGDNMSPAGRFIVENATRAPLEYRIKQAWQFIHSYSCFAAARVVRESLCGKAFSIFRSVNDGWLIADYTLAYGSPLPKIPVAQGLPALANYDSQIKLAREFFSRHELKAGCVILTAIPTGYDFSGLARAIAEALGTPYINPAIDGLTMIDGAHLDAPSASAWSERFWIEATPTITRCLKPKDVARTRLR
jgi:hypothetical protein